jgi:hypothetical protein
MARLELFLFRYRDARTGKWTLARYRAERREIEARYAEFQIVGPPEIREIDRDRRRFSPHVDATQCEAGQSSRQATGHSPYDRYAAADSAATIDPVDPASLRGLERFLLLLFLRRYVTYCARHRRFAAMNGAARLHASLVARASED